MPLYKRISVSLGCANPTIVVWLILSVGFLLEMGSTPLQPLSYGITTSVASGAIIAFYGMKTTIEGTTLQIVFGLGIIKKVIALLNLNDNIYPKH